MGQLEVEFGGRRAGTGPVTLGQANVLEWIGEREQERSEILCRFVPVPAGRGLEDIRESLAILLARHEALRTTVDPGPPPTQTVASAGRLIAELHELDADVEAVLHERIASSRFDYGRDLPFRVAVATRSGTPYLVALALSHLAADFASVLLLAGEFAELLADPGIRTAGPGRHQPLDQAALESTPAARRRAESALRFWDRQLRRTPPGLLAIPPRGPRGCREGYLRSRAAGMALPQIVARTGVGRSTVLLAALCALLGVRTGNPRGALVSICGNRFRPGMAEFVGTVAQDALITFELNVSTMDDLVRAVRVSTVSAYRHSQFDAKRVWAVIEAVAVERGTRFQRDCVFNDIDADRTVDLEPPGARRDTTFRWLPATSYPVACYFTVINAGPDLELTLYGDTRYLPEPDIEAFLRGIEALLLACAETPVPIAELSTITGIRPVGRGPGWVRHDGCWVELAAVRRMLAEVTRRPANVFAHNGELVGYLAGDLEPRRVHAACVATLAGRYTAVAPSSYVVCAEPPDDLDDVAAWAAQPVLTEGSGRP